MQYLNLSRLDNTLKNNVLWPDGWMKMAWVSCGMNIVNGKISCYPCQGEILYNEPYCWREESHVQPFLRLYMNSFVQKVQQPTYSFCPVVNVLFCLSNTAWEQIVLMDPDSFLYFTLLVYHDVQGQRAADLYLTRFDVSHHLHKPMVLLWILFLNNR